MAPRCRPGEINTTTFLGDKPINRVGFGAMRLAGPGASGDDAGGVLPAQRPDELREGVEANLRSLRVERLDLVNLRLVGGAPVPLEQQLSALEDMRQEGKLDLIGLSNVDQATVQRALTLVELIAVAAQMRGRQQRASVRGCRLAMPV